MALQVQSSNRKRLRGVLLKPESHSALNILRSNRRKTLKSLGKSTDFIDTVVEEYADYLPQTDVEVALQVLRSDLLFQTHNFNSGAHMPLIFLSSQIHWLVFNHTDVERDLDRLISSGTVKQFKIVTKASFCYMLTGDYNEELDRSQKEAATTSPEEAQVIAIFKKYINTTTALFVTKEELLDIYENTESALTTLVQYGCILIRDENSYWHSIPRSGIFFRSVESGKKDLLKLLRNRSFGILESVLHKKHLRSSPLGITFHLRDLLGSGIAVSVKTASGTLIRLNE